MLEPSIDYPLEWLPKKKLVLQKKHMGVSNIDKKRKENRTNLSYSKFYLFIIIIICIIRQL